MTSRDAKRINPATTQDRAALYDQTTMRTILMMALLGACGSTATGSDDDADGGAQTASCDDFNGPDYAATLPKLIGNTDATGLDVERDSFDRIVIEPAYCGAGCTEKFLEGTLAVWHDDIGRVVHLNNGGCAWVPFTGEPEVRSFTASIALNHGHVFPPGYAVFRDGNTFDITGGANHSHTVTLDESDVIALNEGTEALMLTSSAEAGHSHVVTVFPR